MTQRSEQVRRNLVDVGGHGFRESFSIDGSSNMSLVPLAGLLTGSLLTLGIAVLVIVVIAVRRKRHCDGRNHCPHHIALDASKPASKSRQGSMLEINTGTFQEKVQNCPGIWCSFSTCYRWQSICSRLHSKASSWLLAFLSLSRQPHQWLQKTAGHLEYSTRWVHVSMPPQTYRPLSHSPQTFHHISTFRQCMMDD